MTVRHAVVIGVTIAATLFLFTLVLFLVGLWLFNAGGTVPGSGEGDVLTGLGTR